MKKRAFRTELVAELRELVAVGRRLAAVAEQNQAAMTVVQQEVVTESKGVHCHICERPITFPNADYAWTSDGIYHGFCYENPDLFQDEPQ